MSEEYFKGAITTYLNSQGVSVRWIPNLSMDHKFAFSTEIVLSGSYPRMKIIEELCAEFSHCGKNLAMMFHSDSIGPHRGSPMIYYNAG